MSALQRRLRLGSVSFLNAKPLIYGLGQRDDIDLALDVPSRLLDGLLEKLFDVALLPVIDYQRMPGLRVLTAGGIGCDGPTLTVRIFSPEPIDRITTLACDTDSHTSVALARVILSERYGLSPRILEFDQAASTSAPIPRLLIGDKVISDRHDGFDYQLDLGEAWKDHTGLPFVFAAWMARAGVELGSLNEVLDRARVTGLTHVDEIIAEHAAPRRWPVSIARKYLTEYLKFEIGPRQLDAIRLFHQKAGQLGLLTHEPWALRVETA